MIDPKNAGDVRDGPVWNRLERDSDFTRAGAIARHLEAMRAGELFGKEDRLVGAVVVPPFDLVSNDVPVCA